MILRDWRAADPALLRACYETEALHWDRELSWDTSWSWSTIEEARVTWGLPGLIALDDADRVLGWTFYMQEGGTFAVGGLATSDASATAALLDGVLDEAIDAGIQRASWFVLDRAPGLMGALHARGFDTERFIYLSKDLTADASGGDRGDDSPAMADFGRTSLFDVASLLHESYGPAAARHFAPDGTVHEWAKYAHGLVHARACGLFDPSCTQIRRDDRGLQALALITSLAPATAHLAQLAVRPDCRGRGMAATVLKEACDRARRAGKREMTLLVSEHNDAARRLYEGHGFAPRATFFAALGQVMAPALPAGR